MAQLEYELDDNTAVVTMHGEDIRFDLDFLTRMLEIMDEVEQKTEATALLVKSSHEKFWHNGIDLDYLTKFHQAGDLESIKTFLLELTRLLTTTLLYPIPTVASINGHCFAGGAIWACAFDFRFMRSDRGYFCFPEVDIGIPFSHGMAALIKQMVPRSIINDLHYLGYRAKADELAAAGFVKKALPLGALFPEALAFAKTLNKGRKIYGTLKARMNREVVKIFEEMDIPALKSGDLGI